MRIVLLLVLLGTADCHNDSNVKTAGAKYLVSLSGAEIAGIVFGVVVVIVLAFLLSVGFYILKWRRNDADQVLRLSKYYIDLKDQLSPSLYMFEKQAWAQYLQFLQQKEMDQLAPYEPLKALLAYTENTLDYVQLKKEAARLIGVNTKTAWFRAKKTTNKERSTVVEYLMKIRNDEEEAKVLKDGGVVTVPGCRLEKIQNRKDSQVLLSDPKLKSNRLHMSKLTDYYGFPILLCQAPVKKQFIAHWEAIWQEKVGTVVLVGGYVEAGGRKIDEYFPLTEGGKIACGPFHLRTTLAVPVPGGYRAYRVTVRKENEARELVFIHVDTWPDHKIPTEPAYLADLVWQIQGHQLRQTEKEVPTLLVHCSLGVQRSPALVVAYIGRQMWMANRKVNVLGILRYVRHHRWKAFSMGNPFAQVQIIYGVLQIIATRSQMEGIGPLRAGPLSKRVFNYKARREDAEKLAVKSTTLKFEVPLK